MRDVIFSTGHEGEPLVTVTLEAVEVQNIACAMHASAREHTERVFEDVRTGEDKNISGYRGVEAQAKSHRTAGEWLFIQDQMDEPFWDWIREMNSVDDEEVTA